MLSKRYFQYLTLILLMWRIGWAPNNASRWQMGFNSAFKGLKCSCCLVPSLRQNWMQTGASCKSAIFWGHQIANGTECTLCLTGHNSTTTQTTAMFQAGNDSANWTLLCFVSIWVWALMVPMHLDHYLCPIIWYQFRGGPCSIAEVPDGLQPSSATSSRSLC
jgi:hypothetical protein